MLTRTFDDLANLQDVESVGSDTGLSPLDDESVTIFLKNGYRLVSTKNLFGQSIELQPFKQPALGKPSYSIVVNHTNLARLPKTKAAETSKGNDRELSTEDFIQQISPIISKELKAFLTKRHCRVAYSSKQKPKFK